MLVGPVFNREVVLAPRRSKLFVARAVYVAGLLLLVSTAWAVLAGTQRVSTLGDMARFGTILFQILAPLQLGLVAFFSAVLAASAVAQEKDRRTLVLLLLTRLSNSELVLGKLLASLLNILVMLLAGLPVFMLAALWGGVSFEQIARVFAVTLVSAIACGSLGSTLALWREKTFQAIATTVLALSLWLAVWEIVAMGWLGRVWWGISCQTWAVAFSPLEAILEATRPHVEATSLLPGWGSLATPLNLFLVVAVGGSMVLNALSIVRVRAWNASREARPVEPEEEPTRRETADAVSADVEVARTLGERTVALSKDVPAKDLPAETISAGRSREVWDNPILWREIRTWAYGKKILAIKVAYLVLFGLAAASLFGASLAEGITGQGGSAMTLVPLFLLSLVLVNAQAVTSMTSERDGRALDLLLVTDLSPKEVVFGKLGGVFYNSKEMVALPMGLCAALCATGSLSFENLIYLLGGLAVLYLFVAVLGIHSGMSYPSSQGAIATSLGTVFFLFVGVATCMWILVALGGASFQAQLVPFFVLIVVGGVALYLALGSRNPSAAIGLASFLCPLATFYAITSYLLDYTLGVFLVATVAYGFATAAMLVPAIHEFDVATGRTTADGQ